jgi:hypothetical protein
MVNVRNDKRRLSLSEHMSSKLNGLIRQLKWGDFGTPRSKPAPKPGGFAVGAFTNAVYDGPSWSIDPVAGTKPTEFELKDDMTVTISLKSTSWVADWVFKQPKPFQDGLLVHEQGHYDITALIARDMFIELMQLKRVRFKSVAEGKRAIDEIAQRHSSDVIKVINDKYDSVAETNHGTQATLQQRWNGYIQEAYTKERTPRVQAPDGTAYKVPFLDVLMGAKMCP